MKTITPQDHDLIIDVRSEGVTSLPAAVIEKDLLVTEALQSILATPNNDVTPIFCGGTCLSKAYRLIDRMSEDIDFKLAVTPGHSRSARNRLLSGYKKQLIAALEVAGFSVPADRVIARNENQYVSISLQYQSRFTPVASLRPEIKVELNARGPLLSTTLRPISSMLNGFTGVAAADFGVQCVSIEETLSEKVLSFLRRTAEVRAGRNRGDYDERLVRHLYDVQSILAAHPAMAMPSEHFAAIAREDATQYRNQFPEFYADPLEQMRSVLDALKSDNEYFERHYRRFVDELVFGDRISYDEARSAFTGAADALLSESTLALQQASSPDPDRDSELSF